MAGRDHEGHVGADGDVSRTIRDLGAMEGVVLGISRPYLPQADVLVEALDFSSLDRSSLDRSSLDRSSLDRSSLDRSHFETQQLVPDRKHSGDDFRDRQLDDVRSAGVFQLGDQPVYGLFRHHGLDRVAASSE